MIYILLGVVAAIIILCFAVLLILSPGKIKQFKDENGKIIKNSIAEKSFVIMNGFKMGMIIKSMDSSNPVLLFVHGGPGMPEYFLTEDYPTGLEKYFTVVWWDQRGAGLSFSKDVDENTLTSQYIDDTIAVTNYLRERFGQDKIYLMAHSWGSYFGIQAVQKAPQLYRAYIAVAQVTYQDDSERIAYKYMFDYYSKACDTKTLKKLRENDCLSDGYYRLRDDIMHRAGIGTTHDMKSVVMGILFASLKNTEYTLAQKINIWRGKLLLNNNIRLKMNADIRKIVPKLDVPIYFFSGVHDYTVNYEMTEEYFKQIETPIKGFYLFKNSAHSPILEEPDKAAQIIYSDILNKTNDIADIK